ncbi:hypothetical protein R3W88_023055 [Solanum pinnatisectum]|uniref:Uncharacterized protein n=1 Tax=Solanum pinnatisectum TaxID=50273 RepID=A0AAV9LY58_9SOLN|nr:hypothetical protein R3W88_023055 [Solanum pinnatisectum]
MTDEGLQAILDGCPNLVSLDLPGCCNLSLNKVLCSKISQQIKDVKYPHDKYNMSSIDGVKYYFGL